MLGNLKYRNLLFIGLWFLMLSFETQAQRALPNGFYKDSVYVLMFKSYQVGDLQQVIDVFKTNCLEGGNHQMEKASFKTVKSRIKADIYELAVKAYLALDLYEPAQFFMSRLFAIRYDDDFKDYWFAFRNARENTFYIAPNIMVGMYGGLNGSLANLDKTHTILEPLSNDFGQTYLKRYHHIDKWFSREDMIGWHLGIHGEYGLTKNISTNLRLQYSSYKFGYDATNSWRNNLESTGTADKAQIVDYYYQHYHTLGYVHGYYGFEYKFFKTRLQPSIHIGGFYNRLFTAEKTVIVSEKPGRVDYQGNTIYFTGTNSTVVLNVDEVMGSGYWGISSALGCSYQFEYFYAKAEARYHQGFNNIISPKNRLNMPELVYGFHDVFDDLSIQNFELSFGIYVPISYKSFKR